MKLKGIFTALLAAALVCLLPVTALAGGNAAGAAAVRIPDTG